MCNKTKEYIDEMFLKINTDVSKIIESSATVEIATQQIMETVSSKITVAIQGYMIDIYSELSKATLSEPIFQKPENANKFYGLNLRQKISQAYQFDIQDLRAYTEGISYNEIGKTYATAGAVVGSAAVGGILLGILSGTVHLPLVVVIAGAVACGVAGGMVADMRIDNINKDRYKNTIMIFMSSLKDDLIKWVDDVIAFYNQEVNDLKDTL